MLRYTIMCRLFFLLGFSPKKKKELMEEFLLPPEAETYSSGFGFASKNPQESWEVYRSTLSYTKAKKIKKKEEEIDKNMTEIAEKEIVVGHLRRKKFGKNSISNTQPFLYDNHVFCHNGMISGYNIKKNRMDINRLLKTGIDPSYPIKGNTDSERLFYLFLTFKQKVEQENPGTRMDKLLTDAMTQTIAFLETMNTPIYFNVIYCNAEFAIITRYIIHKKQESDEAPSLYYNNTQGGVLISSEPMEEGSESIRENAIVLIKL